MASGYNQAKEEGEKGVKRWKRRCKVIPKEKNSTK